MFQAFNFAYSSNFKILDLHMLFCTKVHLKIKQNPRYQREILNSSFPNTSEMPFTKDNNQSY